MTRKTAPIQSWAVFGVCIGIVSGQDLESIQYDPATGLPIAPPDTVEVVLPAIIQPPERVAPEAEPSQLQPQEYDPLTGQPIVQTAAPVISETTFGVLDPLRIRRLANSAAAIDHRNGRWAAIGAVSALGGGMVGMMWAGMLTGSGGLAFFGGLGGAWAASIAISNAQQMAALPAEMVSQNDAAKLKYRKYYKVKTRNLRNKGTLLGLGMTVGGTFLIGMMLIN